MTYIIRPNSERLVLHFTLSNLGATVLTVEAPPQQLTIIYEGRWYVSHDLILAIHCTSHKYAMRRSRLKHFHVRTL